MNVFEKITKLRQLPFILDNSLIALSLLESTTLPMLLYQLRML